MPRVEPPEELYEEIGPDGLKTVFMPVEKPSKRLLRIVAEMFSKKKNPTTQEDPSDFNLPPIEMENMNVEGMPTIRMPNMNIGPSRGVESMKGIWPRLMAMLGPRRG